MKLLLPLFLLLSFANAASAVQMLRVEQYTLATNESLHEQIFVVADQARVAGAVHDDIFIMGNVVDLTGAAGNDAWLAGNTVSLSGSVADHARLAGNSINVRGVISNSLSAAGSAVQISTNANIMGSANIVASSVSIEGHVAGNVRIMSEQATVAGICDGDVRIVANDIVVMPGAVIGGDLTYTSAKALVLDPKVTLHGELIRKEPGQAAAPSFSLSELAVLQALFLAGAFLAGLIFTGVFPRFSAHSAQLIRQSPLRCAFVGVIGFCLIPMLAMMALVTFIGIPLALLLLAGYALMIYVGKMVVALAVGSLMTGTVQGVWKRVMALLLGLVVLYAAPLVPAAGTFVWLLASFLGLGAILSCLFESQRAPAPVPAVSPDVEKSN